MTIRRLTQALGFAAAMLLLAACHQNGTVYAVDTTADTVDVNPGDGLCADASGDCSLRAAIQEANATPGIEEISLVDDETYLLTIAGANEDEAATGDLDITEQVVITGEATIDAGGLDRVFDLRATTGVTEFWNMTITGGNALEASVLRIANGNSATVMQEVNIEGNEGDGTAILSTFASLFVWNSSLFDNDISTYIENRGGLVSLRNTTIADPDRGGIASLGGGNAEITFSTITGGDYGILGNADVMASIVDDHDEADCLDASITSLGDNIESGTSCGFTAASDLQNTDPGLLPIGGYFGPVAGRPPFAGSPAVDSATCSASIATDANGTPRPTGAACDRGAVEIVAGDDCAAPVSGGDATFCDLDGASLPGAGLDDIDLEGATLVGADLSTASVQDARIVFADLSSATLDGADFSGADIGDATLSGSSAVGTDFTGADLETIDATGADFTGADLTDVNLEDADFTGATLTGVVWNNTNCPDGSNSDTNGGTCIGFGI
ncbi:MAG: pentapeptide repeat-containing protein [Actinomycetota bacterium]